jgi:hypothetical protein
MFRSINDHLQKANNIFRKLLLHKTQYIKLKVVQSFLYKYFLHRPDLQGQQYTKPSVHRRGTKTQA